MCLKADVGKKFSTAKEDIVTYKIVGNFYEGHLSSIYFQYHYKIGELNKISIKTIHKNKEKSKSYNKIEYNQGFHSWIILDYVKLIISKYYQCYIVECIIPKGSKILYGDNNDIISDQIIINKIFN